MNELKYNLYFTQLLLNIKEQKEIKTLCENINKELSSSEENDCKIIFLSQFTDNTIKLFQFNTIQEVEDYTRCLQKWLDLIPCMKSLIDTFQYSLMIKYIILSKKYYQEIDNYSKDTLLNSILNDLNKISIPAIILPFLNYCLRFYLQKGISLLFKNTCDRLTLAIDTLINNNDLKDLGRFKIPLLESDLEE